MSVILQLMSSSPSFSSSRSTPVEIPPISFSRSELISSIVIVAMTMRIWPVMISWASWLMSTSDLPSSRLAAAIISSGFLEIAMVKFDGTLTRIFWDERASSSSILMLSGRSDMNP